MAIPGLFIRSFGTGPDALNNAEANALKSMRDRQAFADEQEARRRRAEMEEVAKGAVMPGDATVTSFGKAPGDKGDFVGGNAYRGAEALAATYGSNARAAAATAAGAPNVGVINVPGNATLSGKPIGGLAVPGAASTTAAERQRHLDYENAKQAVGRATARINQMTVEANQIPREIGRTISYSEGVQRQRQLEKEIAFERANQTKLVAEMQRLAKPAPAPIASTSKPITTPEEWVRYVELQKPAAQFQQLAQAVMQAESRGDPNAVSPKGAVGRMQVMPETLASPGYGIAPAQDNSDAENVRVGTEYLAAMLREFNGNTTHALAAYNWGPGNTKAWIAKGAKFEDLPEETQKYIPRVGKFFNSATAGTAGATATTQLGAAPSAATLSELPVASKAIDYSNAVPRKDLQYRTKLAERDEIKRIAIEAKNRGLPDLYMQSVAKLNQLDTELVYLQGMVGLGDLVDNPRATDRLSQVMSHYRGEKEGYYRLQVRSDGKYNEIVNGKISQTGLTLQEVIDKTRMVFDEGYATSVNATRATRAEAAIKVSSELELLAAKSGFTVTEMLATKQADAYLQTLKSNDEYKRAIDVARLTSQGKAAEPKFFNTTDGVTLMSVGTQLFKVLLQDDGKGGQVPGSEYLVPLTGGLVQQ